VSSNIYQKARLGVIHFKAYPEVETGEGPIIETLEKLAEDEFWSAVEVGWIKDYRVRNTVRHILEQSHLSVAFASQPRVLQNRLNLNSLDKRERALAVDTLKRSIDEAHEVGAEVVRLIAGRDPGDSDREEAKKLLVDSLFQLLEYAKEEGQLDFTLKLFDRDIDKRNLIGPTQDALDIAEAVYPHHSNFGLLVDLSHYPLLRENPRDSIPKLAKYLRSVHVGNCVYQDRRHPAYGDIQPRFGLQGGENDTEQVVEFFQILEENGFFTQNQRPIISAEVRPVLAGEKSGLILANAKRVIRDAWAFSGI